MAHLTTTRHVRVHVAPEGHRVTTFELFFDLVFVFAITQITGFVAEAHAGMAVVRGLVVLGLLWWMWSSYTWLGNQARADVGLIRLGMVVAMAAIFVVALTIPEAWHDEPGGLRSPLVLACAYVLIRVIHQVLYLLAAQGDRGLQRQLTVNAVPLSVGGVLLIVGAVVGDDAQTLLWGLALAVDWTITYVQSLRVGGWRIHSVEHWVERHGLVVILALGESVVAIGVGASGTPLDWSLLVGAALGIGLATALWWLYFDVSAKAAERSLHRRSPDARVRAAIDSYSYLHFWIIAGIVIAAVGIEEVLAHADDDEALGGFAASCLCLGPAAYLAGHVMSWIRLDRVVKRPRLVCAAVLAATTPIAAAIVPLAALALVTGILAVLVVTETVRYADVRAELAATTP